MHWRNLNNMNRCILYMLFCCDVMMNAMWCIVWDWIMLCVSCAIVGVCALVWLRGCDRLNCMNLVVVAHYTSMSLREEAMLGNLFEVICLSQTYRRYGVWKLIADMELYGGYLVLELENRLAGNDNRPWSLNGNRAGETLGSQWYHMHIALSHTWVARVGVNCWWCVIYVIWLWEYD